MTQIKAIALQAFVHNRHSPRRGSTIDLTQSEFRDLEQAGLVRAGDQDEQPSKAAPQQESKPAAAPATRVARAPRSRTAPPAVTKPTPEALNKGAGTEQGAAE